MVVVAMTAIGLGLVTTYERVVLGATPRFPPYVMPWPIKIAGTASFMAPTSALAWAIQGTFGRSRDRR